MTKCWGLHPWTQPWNLRSVKPVGEVVQNIPICEGAWCTSTRLSGGLAYWKQRNVCDLQSWLKIKSSSNLRQRVFNVRLSLGWDQFCWKLQSPGEIQWSFCAKARSFVQFRVDPNGLAQGSCQCGGGAIFTVRNESALFAEAVKSICFRADTTNHMLVVKITGLKCYPKSHMPQVEATEEVAQAEAPDPVREAGSLFLPLLWLQSDDTAGTGDAKDRGCECCEAGSKGSLLISSVLEESWPEIGWF